MILANELRSLEPPGAAPDLTRAIAARIERLETSDPAVRPPDVAPPTWNAWITWLAVTGVALGVVLVVASIGPWVGASGRALTVAIPAGPVFRFAPIALGLGLLLYVSGLWFSVQTEASPSSFHT